MTPHMRPRTRPRLRPAPDNALTRGAARQVEAAIHKMQEKAAAAANAKQQDRAAAAPGDDWEVVGSGAKKGTGAGGVVDEKRVKTFKVCSSLLQRSSAHRPPPALQQPQPPRAARLAPQMWDKADVLRGNLLKGATRYDNVRTPRPFPPSSRTKWTRRVPHPVLIGHAASLTPY